MNPQPKLRPEEGQHLEVDPTEAHWKEHCWSDEEWLYSDNPGDLTRFIAEEENKLSKERYLRGLRWIMEKYR